MKRFVPAILLAILLTGCTKDVTIQTQSGKVNLGQVTAEVAQSRVIGNVLGKNTDLGVHNLGMLHTSLSTGFKAMGVKGTDIIQNDLLLDIETMVTYKGSLNTASKIIDERVVECPSGLMFDACMTKLEDAQGQVDMLFRTQHSFVK